MGKLVETKIPTLFGGVSRQPTPVRQPNQLEEVTNAISSVVTGGFEKRPGTQTISKLSFLDATDDFKIHPIDRDAAEQTFLAFGATTVQAINAITGAQITVNVGDTTRHFLADATGVDSTGILQVGGANMSVQLAIASGETTFDWSWELSDTSTQFDVQGSADGSTWNDIQSNITGAASGTFSTTIGAVAAGDHNYIRVNIDTAAGAADDTLTLKATFKDLTYLLGASPEDLRIVSVADNSFVINRNVTVAMAEASSGTITSTVQQFADLPTAAGDNSIHRVQGDNTSGFDTYYVIDDSATTTYIETVNPNGVNDFQINTMPHRLIREADGTFTYMGGTWASRAVGDVDVLPVPGFVGKKIQEITFFRNRLAILADENVILSRSGDVFNFWPEKAVEVLDSDPIDRAATTNSVNILKAATTFRKIMFCTAARAQFELTSTGAFTPESAEFDQATTYTSSTISRAESMGDVLYFGAGQQNNAIVYEYFFDETSLSNTAADVTKHVLGYIPTNILDIRADPTTQTVFVLTTGEQNSVYVYRTFFDGNEKLQSAWGKYQFASSEANGFVHGMAVFSGFLVLVIERDDGSIYLEQIPIEREDQDATMGYTPFLDQRQVLTGSYSAGTNLTTWTTAYAHNDDVQVILGPAFSEPGRILNVNSYSTSTTVTAVGDFSANQVYVGRPFTMTCELSKLFPRDDSGAILHGRMQLKDIVMQYVDTGYFEVKVTLPARDPYSVKFEGKNLGSEELMVGSSSIASQGAFTTPVHGLSETAKIEIINDQPLPCIITAAAYIALFNELSRQE